MVKLRGPLLLSTRRIVIRGALALLLLSRPVVCLADRWHEDYTRGVELLQDGQCSREAIEHLHSAVDDKKKSKLNARTIAQRFIDYLPHFQLATAHFQCGELEAARHYVDKARHEGVTPEHLLVALEDRIITQEAPKPDSEHLAGEQLKTQGAAVSEIIDQADGVVDQVRELGAKDDRYRAAVDAEAERLDQGTRLLRTARQLLTEGLVEGDPLKLSEAQGSAENARSVLNEVLDQVASTPSWTPTPPPVRPPVHVPTGPTKAPSIPRPTKTPSVNQKGDALSQGHEGQLTHDSSETGVEPSELRVFRSAAGDFVNARHREVVKRLSPDKFSSKANLEAAASLLIAASHYALYFSDSPGDRYHLRESRRLVVQAQALNASLQPDPRFFSPDFVDFYHEAR